MSDEAICGRVSLRGRLGEPLACGFHAAHEGGHSWGSLPMFVSGSVLPIDITGAVVESFERSEIFDDGSGGDDFASITIRLPDGRRFSLFGDWHNDSTADIGIGEA